MRQSQVSRWVASLFTARCPGLRLVFRCDEARTRYLVVMCHPDTRSGLAGSHGMPVLWTPERARRSRGGEGTWMAGKRAGGRVTAVQPVMERLDLLKPDAIGIAQATVIG